MREQVAWMVGGQQGEGIDSTGEILASALARLGFHIYGYRTFGSRIKGGHTNYKLRVANERVLAQPDAVDVLVAFDQETIQLNVEQVTEGGVVVADASPRTPVVPADRNVHLVALPITAVARELGNAVMKNMVGVGVSAALLGLEPELFDPIIGDRFAEKGEKLVQANREALRRGYQLVAGRDLPDLVLARPTPRRRLILSGDHAAALGALVAGCRFLAAYPITPASEIMEWLAEKLPNYGGVVMQAEDEIAAICMAIGAGYAGARAMTSTSGPGFSLMMEALGYAGMTETPVVIVDVQRAGPSTGMPTKQEQSDLGEMLYGSHGDMPRIVVAPSTVEECFYDVAEAFNLAERYQTPVIVAMDLALGLCRQTVDELDKGRIRRERGLRVAEEYLETLDGKGFARYEVTPSGVSPRSLPGQKNGFFLATGLEHDPYGHITENRANRVRMVEKRLRKVASISTAIPGVDYQGPDHPEVLLVAWGSTRGPVDEARRRLTAEGLRVGHAHVRILAPFPATELAGLVAGARQVLVVENNATGQLARLIRQEVEAADKRKVESILKYDGTPFTPREVVEACREVLVVEH
ncbi:MAG: 2-oxoacid:acceptor oxidoreductase subunit alpha [Clostridia bacterium]|nr:2-oxoacid:acceptor oxidoreductase subunit alpha [Clostridia bacterium]